jgi:uncharacterized Tic20 family protein
MKFGEGLERRRGWRARSRPGKVPLEVMETMSLVTTRRSSSERLAVLIAHAGTLVAWILAPLLVYLLKRGDSRYVEFQAMQSLVWSTVGTLLAFVTWGVAIPIFLVWHIVAAVKTANGEDYEYPLIGDFVRGLLR